MKPMPLILLVGEAGVGKDTAAELMKELLGEEQVFVTASAKALKEFARTIFHFTDEQLYGPSESRNTIDPRFGWPNQAYKTLFSEGDLGTKLMDWGRPRTKISEENLKLVVANVVETLNTFALQNKGLSPRIVLQILGTEYGRQLYRNLWIEQSVSAALGAIETGKWLSIITDGRFLNEVYEAKKAGGIVLKLVGDSTINSVHQSEKEIGAIPSTLIDYTIYNHKSGGKKALKEKLWQILLPLTSTHVVSEPSDGFEYDD
jgi:hypothetical protein